MSTRADLCRTRRSRRTGSSCHLDGIEQRYLVGIPRRDLQRVERRFERQRRRVPQPVGHGGVQGPRQGGLGRRLGALVRGLAGISGNFFNTQSVQRKPGGRRGCTTDTDNNQNDFNGPSARHHPAGMLGSAATLRYNQRRGTPRRARCDVRDAARAAACARGSGGAACRAIATSTIARSPSASPRRARAMRAPLALVATGGWARRELAPYSDIDFIVLHDQRRGAREAGRRSRCCIRCGTRSSRSATRCASRGRRRGSRATISRPRPRCSTRATSPAIARLTDRARARDARGARAGRQSERADRAARAPSRSARHERFGASLYLLEPNLKQGIGALRDLATALWAAQVRWHPPRPGEDPRDAPSGVIADLVAMGHLTRRQARRARRRARLHAARARARPAHREAPLRSADVRDPGGDRAARCIPTRAPHEGDIRRAVAPAVEALMRDYYLHARGSCRSPIGCSRARACRRGSSRGSRRSTPASSRSTASSRSRIRGCSPSGRARWCGCSASRSPSSCRSTATRAS